jgi:peptidyl-prolyl cis-trans isomerase A (cyclophilin A)
MDLMTGSLLLVLAQASAPPAAPAPAATPFSGPVVVLETSMGNIKLGLYPDKTPVTVQNFLSYVRKHHYDGTIFHRVIADFMIQGGGLDATMTPRPTDPPIRNEAKLAPHNTRGTIAMARTADPDSASSQFFINVKDNFGLDFGVRDMGYTVFGEVLEGMDVVDKIKAVPTASDVPLTSVVIKSARILGQAPVKATAPAAPRPAPAAKPSVKPAAPPAKP